MDKWLDPYLGQGATDIIWFWPHSERPETLRNREPEKKDTPADQPKGDL